MISNLKSVWLASMTEVQCLTCTQWLDSFLSRCYKRLPVDFRATVVSVHWAVKECVCVL